MVSVKRIIVLWEATGMHMYCSNIKNNLELYLVVLVRLTHFEWVKKSFSRQFRSRVARIIIPKFLVLGDFPKMTQ